MRVPNSLGEKETRRQVRSGEFMRPFVANPLSYEVWREAGTDELALPTERVEEVLTRRAAGPEPLEDQVAVRAGEVCGLAQAWRRHPPSAGQPGARGVAAIG